MQAFRSLVHGWIGKVLLVLFSLPFIFFGVQSSFSSKEARGIVASVGDVEINNYSLDREVERMKRQMLDQLGENADPSIIDQFVSRSQVLESMIDREVLAQASADLSMAVSRDNIYRQIRENEIFQEEGVFSQARYERLLRNNGVSPVEFPSILSQEMVVGQLRTGIQTSAFSVKKESSILETLNNQERSFDYVLLRVADFKNRITISDDEIQVFYDANNDRYQTLEKFELEYISVQKTTFLDQVSVDSTEINDEYEIIVSQAEAEAESLQQRKLSHILISFSEERTEAEALALAIELKAKIDAGDSFAILAKTNSNDALSASEGGDMGFIAREVLPKPLEEVLFALELNQVSEPVQSEEGFHLLKYTDTQKTKVASFYDLKEKIKTDLLAQKAEELYAEKLDELSTLAYEAADLQSVAEELALKTELTGLVDRGDVHKGILANANVVKAAFTTEVFEEKRNSDLIEIDSDHSVVIRLSNYLKPETKPLDSVKDDIRDTLKDQKATNQVLALGDELSLALLESESLHVIAAKHKLAIKTAKNVKRNDVSIDRGIISQAFKMPKPSDTAINDSVALANNDFALIVLNSVSDGKQTDRSDEEKLKQLQSLAQTAGEQDFQSFMRNIKSKTDIARY